MAYSVLYHNELNIKSIEKTYPKTLHQLQNGDFKSADVRKMGDTSYYRARLDIRDRLLFSLILFKGQKYILLLEVIKDHNYARSRFLRCALFPEDDKLLSASDPEKELNSHTPELSYLNASNHSVHLLNKFISFDELQQSIFSCIHRLLLLDRQGAAKRRQYWKS